ncbi:MAG: vWA domain-containing protein [Synergistota bacterium]|nr:vWA domain-containing protein [Synergistota bacterium]
MQTQPTLPDEVTKRPLHFFYLVDSSGSMTGAKINSLNHAIREVIPEIKSALSNHPEVQAKVRAIRFSSDVSWHVGPDAVDLESFVWNDIQPSGRTSTSGAVRMLVEALDIENMPRRGYPPVCILVSDGYCTDAEGEYESAIDALNRIPWGKKAVRISIGVGNEGEYDEEELLRFSNQSEVGLLKAQNAAALVQHIKWASTAAAVGASMGKSKLHGEEGEIILLDTPPQPMLSDQGDVF